MCKMLVLLAAGAALASTSAFAVPRGELLASTCLSCHGPGGKSIGAIPTLTGLEKAYFVKMMQLPASSAAPTPWSATPTVSSASSRTSG